MNAQLMIFAVVKLLNLFIQNAADFSSCEFIRVAIGNRLRWIVNSKQLIFVGYKSTYSLSNKWREICCAYTEMIPSPDTSDYFTTNTIHLCQRIFTWDVASLLLRIRRGPLHHTPLLCQWFYRKNTISTQYIYGCNTYERNFYDFCDFCDFCLHICTKMNKRAIPFRYSSNWTFTAA